MRIVKEAEERKKEILDKAGYLFFTKGYNRTTINDILNAVGIAKGTFYYYFKSKEEVMDAIIMYHVDKGVSAAKKIANDKSLTVYEKIYKILVAQKLNSDGKKEVIEILHKVENIEMHQKSSTAVIRHLTPVLTQVIKEGIEQKIFATEYPKETVELMLIEAVSIFDDDIFECTEEERERKAKAFIHIQELAFGAEKGSFAFLLKLLI